MMESELPPLLKHLVSWSVSLLGDAIKEEHGEDIFLKIENLRIQMKQMRRFGPRNWKRSTSILFAQYKELEKLTPTGQMVIAHSFSSMLELINRCESAYRDFRLSSTHISLPKKKPEAIVFVLTAHPTEARSPETLAIFRLIQEVLSRSLVQGKKSTGPELFHLLKMALRVPMARESRPTVLSEATHIFENVLKEDILSLLIEFREKNLPVMFRSWVGGDKDGHPGVNERTMLQSLTLSRKYLLIFIQSRLDKVVFEASIIKDLETLEIINQIKKDLKKLVKIQDRDGIRVLKFVDQVKMLHHRYKEALGFESEQINKILYLLKIFPALVLTLEIREDSAIIKESLKNPQRNAIGKMLFNLKRISEGMNSKHYVRGFVLSMVKSVQDLENGISLVKKTMGELRIPVVPLFETEEALLNAHQVLEDIFLKQKQLAKIHKKEWDSRFEVMLGYSDSAKEIGVFASRLLISQAMDKIDKTLRDHNLTPVFFHGSGGSVERGGGSIKEQSSWWPKSSLNIFKATVQGEMVARSFASSNILKGQIYKIASQINEPRKIKKKNEILKKFSENIKNQYQKIISDPQFLEVVEKAGPYLYLKELKIGSRPTTRNPVLKVGGLRAIPWILCWTQTRVLFPTWWGIGYSWEKMDKGQKSKLLSAYKTSEVFSSFIKILGFTLAKVDLAIWRLYLEKSGLPQDKIDKTFNDFYLEFIRTLKFVREISGKKHLLWHRPWLGTSITYRSSMIHPLNILQLLALKNHDNTLLRETVTGIACGMLTTG